MTNRVPTVFAAAFLGCLVGAPSIGLAAPTRATADAGDAGACLAGPKGAAPSGERWYYRVEKGTKRHCWYTRAQTPGSVASRTQPSPPSPTEAETANETTTMQAPRQPAPLQPAVANARAEISRVTDTTAPSSPFPPPTVTAAPTEQNPAPAAADAPNTTVAERWSDQPNAGRANQPDLPNGYEPPGSTQPSSRTAASQAESTPLWILLTVIGGVLAMVGIVTALIRTFAGSARYARPDTRWAASRWQTEAFDAGPPIADIDDAPVMKMDVTRIDPPPMNWMRIARENAAQPDDEIKQLLSRRARPAA